MNALTKIASKYQSQLGTANEPTTFFQGAVAAEAAAELAAIQEPVYIERSEYLFVWRLGQVLGNAGYFASIRHEADGVYQFNPAAI